MHDPTEQARREMTAEINIESDGRESLEAKYGEIWDTTELKRDFEVHGFMAPFVSVTRKSDGVKGTIMFQHGPRFYFKISEDSV